jgi:hypothetical protein
MESSGLRVSFVAPLHKDDELAKVIQDWLASDAGRVSFDETAPSALHGILEPRARQGDVHIWLSLDVVEGKLRLYAVDPVTQRFLVRHVFVPTELDELAREQVAQIVVALREAFAQRRIASTRQEVERALQNAAAPQSTLESTPAPSRNRTPASATRDASAASQQPAAGLPTERSGYFEGSLGYQLRLPQPGPIAHGFEARVALGIDSRQVDYEFGIVARHSWERTLRGDALSLQLLDAVVGAVLAAHIALGRHWSWGIEGGPSLFWQRFSPEPLSSDLSARQTGRLFQGGLTLATGPRLERRWGSAQLGLSLDCTVNPTRYEVAGRKEPTVLWSTNAPVLGAFIRYSPGRVPL